MTTPHSENAQQTNRRNFLHTWLQNLRTVHRKNVRQLLIIEVCLLVVLLGLTLLSPIRHEPLKVLFTVNLIFLLPLRLLRAGLKVPTTLWLQWVRVFLVLGLIGLLLSDSDLGETAWPLLLLANLLALDAFVSAVLLHRWNFLLFAVGVVLFSFGLLAAVDEHVLPWMMLLGAGLIFGVSWIGVLLSLLWWGGTIALTFAQPDLVESVPGQYIMNTATLHGSTIVYIAAATYVCCLVANRVLPRAAHKQR